MVWLIKISLNAFDGGGVASGGVDGDTDAMQGDGGLVDGESSGHSRGEAFQYWCDVPSKDGFA